MCARLFNYFACIRRHSQGCENFHEFHFYLLFTRLNLCSFVVSAFLNWREFFMMPQINSRWRTSSAIKTNNWRMIFVLFTEQMTTQSALVGWLIMENYLSLITQSALLSICHSLWFEAFDASTNIFWFWHENIEFHLEGCCNNTKRLHNQKEHRRTTRHLVTTKRFRKMLFVILRRLNSTFAALENSKRRKKNFHASHNGSWVERTPLCHGKLLFKEGSAWKEEKDFSFAYFTITWAQNKFSWSAFDMFAGAFRARNDRISMTLTRLCSWTKRSFHATPEERRWAKV